MRLQAQAKMGYYPTPVEVAIIIARCLKRAGPGRVRILDPCAGTGAALKIVSDHLGTESYGIELDKERGQEAQNQLHACLIGDYAQAAVSQGSMSLLYLNPPYDWASRAGELDTSERYERTFLRDTIKYLCPGGVLVYLIPQQRLDRPVAKILSYHFERLRVLRFPEALYQRFKQVVVLGLCKKHPAADDFACFRLVEAGDGRTAMGELPLEPDFAYPVPVSPQMKSFVFRPGQIDPVELEKELHQSALFTRLAEQLANTSGTQRLKAVLPLRHGHLAQLIACGLVGGVVRDHDGRNPLVVKGVTRKVVEHRVERDGPTERHIETDRFVITIQAFNQDGELLTIQ